MAGGKRDAKKEVKKPKKDKKAGQGTKDKNQGGNK